MKITTATRSAMAQVLADRITTGAGSFWSLKFYAGVEPDAIGVSHLGSLLASVPNYDMDPTVVDGSIVPYAFSSINAALSGTLGYAVVTDRDGVDVCFLSCGLEGNGADIELDGLDFIAGAPVVINAFSIPVGM